MEKITLQSSDNVPYSVELPEPTPRQKSAYLFAYAKSGSTLMDNMISDYCRQVGTACFSLFGQAFAQGIRTSDVRSDALVCFRPEGFVYSGFRHYPQFTLPLENETIVLLVRDPRDMLVSLYFSIAKSHVIPKGNAKFKAEREQAVQQSIDEFVTQRADGYLRQFRRYEKQLDKLNVRVYRYEDVIYDKGPWLRDMVRVIGLPEKPDLIGSIASRFDVVPEQEQEAQHIRQVHPGNHRRKLKPETISKINQTLEPFLSAHGYRDADDSPA